jgi:AcrR family transcriptional regulator
VARPKNSQREDVRALVLEKAMELFQLVGWAKVTIRRLAGEIGYTPGTIYLYFTNKDAILNELRNEGFRLLSKNRKKMVPSDLRDPLDRLRLGGHAYLTFALENPELYDLMFNMPGSTLCDIVDTQHVAGGDQAGGEDHSLQSFEVLKQNIALCQAEGYLAGADLDLAAFTFWSALHGMARLLGSRRVPPGLNPSLALADQAVGLLVSLVQKGASPRYTAD